MSRLIESNNRESERSNENGRYPTKLLISSAPSGESSFSEHKWTGIGAAAIPVSSEWDSAAN